MTSIDIGVTTVCRPLLLQSALNSLICTSRHPDWTVRILVVDNDADGSAFEMVNQLAATSPVPIIYLHEPRRGVSHARNAILKARTADYLAFFDDDQIADQSWLEFPRRNSSQLLGRRCVWSGIKRSTRRYAQLDSARPLF